MNNPSTIARLSRDEILASLMTLGEDPTAARVDALHARIDAAALPAGERADVVRAAVDAACMKLNAPLAGSGKVRLYDLAASADQAFEDYDFGNGVEVTDTSGWEYSGEGFERTRKVYLEAEREDDGPAPRSTLTFTVRLNSDGSLAEAYAIDSRGQIWGSMPDRKMPENEAEDSLDYTVTVELSITADSPEQAAEFALDDLRDRSIGPINFDVENLGSKKVVTVSTGEVLLPWERDDIQFPRLLAEIMATQDKLDMAALAASMDLSIEEVNSLFDRADRAWEAAKEANAPTHAPSSPSPSM
ncbi:hypothetical protein R70006_05061 [Paraburkholderia domus]|uniref:hypothetical protein n=1 Tax=Paraburkholderia domus TaxID=2793075 RepID=UPI001914912E|nr:hypothetical protein [Paraburkholderia domus]MBK5051702.1 hypothetical protein [Burkholderia sp. R-70006]CAE6795657.1 hypothetical protein R70006_05061 [Paraburkholderia domus]